jgi:hypothetical protein
MYNLLKYFVERGQKGIDFEKFRRSLVCSYTLVTEVHEVAD